MAFVLTQRLSKMRGVIDFTTVARAAGITQTDPVVGVIAGALSVPLRQVYALLWRAGLLDITD